MLRFLVGLALVLGAWHGLRRSVGAPWRAPAPALAAEAWAVLGGFGVLLAATARPVLSGLFVAGTAAGLVLADRTKRAVLGEPVVFADRAELLEVVRHPRLYLPFAGTGLVLGIAGALMAGVGALAWAEPPLWQLPLLPQVSMAAGAVLAAWASMRLPALPPLLRRLQQAYDRMAPTRDPARDAARWGLLGSAVVHATLARAERPARRQAAASRPQAPFPPNAGPVVLVQAESFIDPRRLHAQLEHAAPGFAALSAEAALAGQLDVPCWGANTVRTEFAVLTGLEAAGLGLDRYNPYEAFARTGLPSLAWQAREAGYRTVFVHPFDLGFYGRTKVLRHLGFDDLVGPEAFRDAVRAGAYVADAEVARVAAQVVRDRGPRVLVLAVTMENHGPWDGVNDPAPPERLPPPLDALPDAAQLGRWLHHLRGTDAMLPVLAAALRDAATREPGSGPGWLAFYGDHQPSLPGALGALLPGDSRTDYMIWSPALPANASRGVPAGSGGERQRDLAAHQLGAALVALAGAAPQARQARGASSLPMRPAA